MKPLSPGADMAWRIAANEAAATEYRFIEKEHLLIGIVSIEKVIADGPDQADLAQKAYQELKAEYSLLKRVLHSHGIDQTKLRRLIRRKLGHGGYKHTEKTIHRSEECRALFAKAAAFPDVKLITTLHLAAAIAENPGDILTAIFSEFGVDSKALRAALLIPPEKALVQANDAQMNNDTPQSYLERYGRDLTQAAKEGRLGPFVGRRNELLQVIQTLARSMKSNPVLVGEAGVGKTAIVEALAVRAVQGKDTQVLLGKKIIELNLGALLGGTKYRGEFEERLTRILEEVKADHNIIIFIDEIHNLIGAGSVGGSMDAANIMKPALARGDIKCIGATTIGEYRRYVETDPALERRFEKVIVNEPSRDEAIEILKGIRPKWEKHFNKKITDKALEAAVDLAIRFDIDHHLPDKAIDLVDKAGARVHVPFLSMVQGSKVNAGAVESVGVTEHTIAEVLSDKMGLPLEIIKGHLEGVSASRLLELSSFLKNKIIGQDEAIDKVSQRLLMVYTGVGKKTGPLAVFLFLGPTGVGKTELAKPLAAFLFGRENALIRLDMSEFKEEHSIAKLIGSPPGYVGHEEEGQLTAKLRSNPYSIVLLDEAEKAHPTVFDLFLQLFDEGRITDAKGRTIDARNVIFIMTSNLMQSEHQKAKIGFLEEKEAAQDSKPDSEALKYFRPELLNRIDEQIVFKPLSEDAVCKILMPMLEEISADLKTRCSVILKFSEEAEAFLAEKGYSPQYGARELRRTVEKYVQIPLSNMILSGKFKEQNAWLAGIDSEKVIFQLDKGSL
ncbi:MAG: ATP-dependent Clp protease ATP-binding subunit [Nitrospirae bacterium]|nr:ATP-dependent Clp protease ATP-binding subunit [Nitrospirota bacterium]